MTFRSGDSEMPVRARRPDIGQRAFRRSGNGPLPGEDIQAEEESTVVAAARRAIVCAACRHPVTSEERRIRVRRSHEHRCVNPYGIRFHIGCFGDAPGCTTWGEPTTEFTWFPGFAWRYAHCTGCNAHLGWRFDGRGEIFFGLVLDRLAAAEEHGH